MRAGQSPLTQKVIGGIVDMPLCVGQYHKEEAQNIQNIKCHDRNECWRKACKDQRGA